MCCVARTCYPSDQYYYGMDWFDAMQCCYYQQAYLAEPTSEEEQSQINAYISICEYVAVHCGPRGCSRRSQLYEHLF